MAATASPARKARPTLRNTVIHVLTVAGSLGATLLLVAPHLGLPGGWVAFITAAVTLISALVTALLGVLNA